MAAYARPGSVLSVFKQERNVTKERRLWSNCDTTSQDFPTVNFVVSHDGHFGPGGGGGGSKGGAPAEVVSRSNVSWRVTCPPVHGAGE